jgi:hypothetical protein
MSANADNGFDGSGGSFLSTPRSIVASIEL